MRLCCAVPSVTLRRRGVVLYVEYVNCPLKVKGSRTILLTQMKKLKHLEVLFMSQEKMATEINMRLSAASA